MATKQERLREIMNRLRAASPFSDGQQARAELARIMREVEDELSGIPEDLNAAAALTTDGRMYPADDRFEKTSGSPQVRLFRQKRHQTWIGQNGALKIASWQGTIEIDLPGADGHTVDSLLEATHELD